MAALNIFITLVMMVMEKYRDIAILMSMGARQAQIRRIFMAQGLLIGAVGSAIGLTAGYLVCHFADKYRWIKLDASVYALSYVPFETHWLDGVWIAAVAILVSFGDSLSRPQRHPDRPGGSAALRYVGAPHLPSRRDQPWSTPSSSMPPAMPATLVIERAAYQARDKPGVCRQDREHNDGANSEQHSEARGADGELHQARPDHGKQRYERTDDQAAAHPNAIITRKPPTHHQWFHVSSQRLCSTWPAACYSKHSCSRSSIMHWIATN